MPKRMYYGTVEEGYLHTRLINSTVVAERNESHDQYRWSRVIGLGVAVLAGTLGASLWVSHASAQSGTLTELDANPNSGSSIVATLDTNAPPHILFVLMDDLGYSDIAYNTYDIPHATPRTTALAETGVILTHYYSENECTPARAAILTGRYPLSTGVQHECIKPTSEWGLPVEERLVSNYLQSMGYKTHIVGKWDIGHFAEELWPTRRGFESFFGLTCYGYMDYFTHMNKDFWDLHEWDQKSGTRRRVEERSGEYSTFMFGQRARHIITEHSQSEPLFLYLPFNAVHNTVSIPLGWNSTKEAEKVMGAVSNPVRRIFAGALYFADAEIGMAVDSLKDAGMYKNSVIIFASDNGGSPADGGLNYPLRGAKKTFFEGGHRVPAWIHSPLLSNDAVGQKYDGLMHATDWLPTIVEGIAQGALQKESKRRLDGFNMWNAINTLGDSPRQEVVLNIDYVNCENEKAYSDIGRVWMGLIVDSLLDGHRYKAIFSQVDTPYYEPFSGSPIIETKLQSGKSNFIFDLTNDPYEANNLLDNEHDAAVLPKLKEIIGIIAERLCDVYTRSMVSTVYNTVDPSGKNFGKRLIVANDYWIYPWREDSKVNGDPFLDISHAPTCSSSEVESLLWGSRRKSGAFEEEEPAEVKSG